MFENEDKDQQYEAICFEILNRIGIKKGEIVLDFGCGDGVYTIPIAKFIGNSGKVYAVDKNPAKLKELSRKAQKQNLNNIEIISTNGEIKLNFPINTFNVVFLYDIFWYFPAESYDLIRLLNEVKRVSKDGALISIYPEHTDREKLKSIFEKHGFLLKNVYKGKVIHEDAIVNGLIYNFIKK